MTDGNFFFSYVWDPKPRKIWLTHPYYPFICVPGIRGGGKSTTIDWIAEMYRNGEVSRKYLIFDAWATPDHENAYWCVPDLVKVFSWRRVPGPQEGKLRDYLFNRFKMKWIHGATCEKSADEKSLIFRYDPESESAKKAPMLNRFYEPSPQKRELIIRLIYRDNRAEMLLDGRPVWMFVGREVETTDGYTVRAIYDKNPKRADHWRVKLEGHAVLVLKPDATKIEFKNPLCRCGFPMKDHVGSPREIPCRLDPPEPMIEFISPELPPDKIFNKAIEEKRVVIFNKGFYKDDRPAYLKLAEILHEIPFLVTQRKIPNVPIFIAIRELSNLVPQGVKAHGGDFELHTKREVIAGIRAYRHYGITLAVDYQRNQDIQKAVASQRDIMVFKRTTPDLLPDELVVFYKEIEMRRNIAIANNDYRTLKKLPSMSRLKDNQAYVLFPDNHFQLIWTGQPGFRHKKTGDHWESFVQTRGPIDYGDPTNIGKRTKKGVELILKDQEERNWHNQMLLIHRLRTGRQKTPWKQIQKDFKYTSIDAAQNDYYKAKKSGMFDDAKVQQELDKNPVDNLDN